MSTGELFRPGESVGRYTIERELGRGGMGCVYLALTADGTRVALKAIRLADARATNVERFQVEARILAGIEHVHLAGFIDAGRHESAEHGAILFIVLEYLEGQTLRALLVERGSVDCKTALRWCIQIAEGLAAIHEADVIHRDLKPENVMIVSGIAKVIDLGIAKAPKFGGKTTERHLKVGTLTHMAPEQFDSGRVGPWTDQYALALLLFELIAGRHALIRPDEVGVLGPPEFIARALLGEPESLSAVATDVPAEVEAIVTRALAKKPEERFPTIVEMRNAMNAVYMQLRLSSHAGSLAAMGGPGEWSPPVARVSLASLSPADTGDTTTAVTPAPDPADGNTVRLRPEHAAALHSANPSSAGPNAAGPMSKTAPLPAVQPRVETRRATAAAPASDDALALPPAPARLSGPSKRSANTTWSVLGGVAGLIVSAGIIFGLRAMRHGTATAPTAAPTSSPTSTPTAIATTTSTSTPTTVATTASVSAATATPASTASQMSAPTATPPTMDSAPPPPSSAASANVAVASKSPPPSKPAPAPPPPTKAPKKPAFRPME